MKLSVALAASLILLSACAGTTNGRSSGSPVLPSRQAKLPMQTDSRVPLMAPTSSQYVRQDYRGNPQARQFEPDARIIEPQSAFGVPAARAKLNERQPEIRPRVGAPIEEDIALAPAAGAGIPPAIKSSGLPPARAVNPVEELAALDESTLDDTAVDEIETAEATERPQVKTPASGLPPSKGSEGVTATTAKVATAKVETIKREAVQKIDNEPSIGSDETVAEFEPPTEVAPQTSEIAKAAASSPECAKAEEEAKKARSSVAEADRLFYYRRALRICPRNAAFHLEIAKVYESIGRTEDAELELRQVLDLDPENAAAKKQLGQMTKSGN